MNIARGLAARIAKRGFTDDAVLSLVDQGLKSTAIQSQLGCTAQVVRHICRKHGRAATGRDYGYTDDVNKTIIQMRTNGIGNTEIADTLGVSGSAIAGKLYRMNLQFDRIKSVAPEMTPEMKAKISHVHQAKRGYSDADVVAMIKSGATQKNVLGRFGCSRNLICRLCKQHDLKIPPRESTGWPVDKVQKMLGLIEEGHDRKEIAARMGITLGAAIAKFNKIGVYPQRKPMTSEPQKVARVRFSGALPDADAIAEFIARNGVTKCPTAAVAFTSATIAVQDRVVLAEYRAARVAEWDEKYITRAKRASEASHRAAEMRR